MRPPGEVFKGYSDAEYDHFRRDKLFITTDALIFLIIVFSIFLALCICFCIIRHKRRRHLRSNVNANYPIIYTITSPPVHHEVVRTPVGASDVPPDYTVVVNQKPMITISNGSSSNYYPQVVQGKKLETPPPAYITVAPFK